MGTACCGGARRDRTADLNTASVALSQLSYGPEGRVLYGFTTDHASGCTDGRYIPDFGWFYAMNCTGVGNGNEAHGRRAT